MPCVTAVAAFWRWRVVSAGVVLRVTFVITSSSELRKAGDAEPAGLADDVEAGLGAEQLFGQQVGIGIGDGVAGAERPVELVQRRAAEAAIGRGAHAEQAPAGRDRRRSG